MNKENTTELLKDPRIAERVTRSLLRGGNFSEPLRLNIETLVHLLKAYNVLAERLQEYFAPHGLSLAKLNLLMVLWTAEDALPMSELGERMSVTCANITKLVDSLVHENFVERRSRPGDRRVILISLTESGQERLKAILPGYYALIATLLQDLTAEEQEQYIHLTMKLRNGITRDSAISIK